MLNGVVIFAIGLVLANAEPEARQKRNGEFTQYFLYNRIAEGAELNLKTPSPDVLRYLPTVVIVHGHEGSYDTSLNLDLRREFLESQDVNVISVDWSIYSHMTYEQAQNFVLSIGEFLANFLRNQQINLASTHLIGFDLGAHIVGVAGRKLNGVARITGLSPTANDIKLSSTDAKYVEVIHTGTGCSSRKGIADKLGQADFYPNGGNCQPGCPNSDCHHNRSWMYFAASIRDNTFNANCCNNMFEKDVNICKGSYIPMGNNKLGKMPCQSGLYRVNTKDSYPF
ncbi:pancreatic lipase-related protein 2-like [Plodia interpunctella]|uniref:pancreatic lipase-related protein 2-like n=1 Tax=Plodia interpunctella TaxID=58824 RepID=UPI002367CD75|nr:pancreatic lipase-related protein 2-like [Plodia interpunctella]